MVGCACVFWVGGLLARSPGCRTRIAGDVVYRVIEWLTRQATQQVTSPHKLAKLLDLVPVMYAADDVSFLASAQTTQKAEASAQTTVDIVMEWSRKCKLVLNGFKSETSCFAFSARDRCPTIHINNWVVRYEPYPKLLGMTLGHG